MWTVDLAVARRIEDAQMWRGIGYLQAQARLRPQSGSMLEPVGGGHILFAGVTSPANKTIGLGMRGPVVDGHLDQVEDFYRKRGSAALVDVCPLADPSLLAALNRRGYRLHHFHNVLARPLDDSVLYPALPAGLTITQAGLADADLWLSVTAQGFGGSEEPDPATLEVMGPNFYSENATCFLAWLGEQPAGGGGMYMHEQAVELGGASTRAAFRRRGVQTALVQARLAAARRAGCDLAVVGTSPGSESQRNLERAGFTLAYTKAIMVL
jgi:GNAT superfamily N-acetyltransferase